MLTAHGMRAVSAGGGALPAPQRWHVTGIHDQQTQTLACATSTGCVTLARAGASTAAASLAIAGWGSIAGWAAPAPLTPLRRTAPSRHPVTPERASRREGVGGGFEGRAGGRAGGRQARGKAHCREGAQDLAAADSARQYSAPPKHAARTTVAHGLERT